MLDIFTRFFTGIATLYLLVYGVGINLPTNHVILLKNKYFMGILMFFLTYYYTGNITLTILAMLFYFSISYIKISKLIDIKDNLGNLINFNKISNEDDNEINEVISKLSYIDDLDDLLENDNINLDYINNEIKITDTKNDDKDLNNEKKNDNAKSNDQVNYDKKNIVDIISNSKDVNNKIRKIDKAKRKKKVNYDEKNINDTISNSKDIKNENNNFIRKNTQDVKPINDEMEISKLLNNNIYYVPHEKISQDTNIKPNNDNSKMSKLLNDNVCNDDVSQNIDIKPVNY
tara:strand:- start:42 stop:905 length:864 start_codon:yes stop_codon:yes gene_type:complete